MLDFVLIILGFVLICNKLIGISLISLRLAFKVYWDGSRAAFSQGQIWLLYWFYVKSQVWVSISVLPYWNTNYSTPVVSWHCSSYSFLWFFLPALVVSSYAFTSLWNFICVQLPFLQYLKSIAIVNSTCLGFLELWILSLHLSEAVEICMDSAFLCCGIDIFSRQRAGTIEVLTLLFSLLSGITVLHCLLFSVGTLFFYILGPIF